MKPEVFSFCRIASSGSFRMLVAIPAFFMLGSPAFAVIVDNSTLDVDSTVPPTDYLVRNNGVLNLAQAMTHTLNVISGSTLNINGATVNAESGIEGISITASRGNLVQADVTSDSIAMMVNRSFSSTQGSTVTATDSQFRGGEAGIQITALSNLTLIDSEVTGQAAGSVGLNMIGGEVHATDGTRISGDRAGVRMVNDSSVSGSNTLVLDGASVEGRNGPAIEVAGGANVIIEVLNNSTLQGSANQLLAVQEASTAAVKVGNSTLIGNFSVTGASTADFIFDRGHMTGDMLVEDGSTANVTLQNQSQFTGRLDKVASVNINDNSNWTLTGDDFVGAMRLEGGRVIFGAAQAPATYFELTVGSLAGTGTFEMKGDFANGQSDFLNVLGQSEGQFDLAVQASGLDAASPQQLTLVRTGTTDGANFALAGDQRVDVGTWSYGLASREIEGGAKEWFLDPTTEVISPGARSVLALFNTAPTVWYGELSSLRSRMGELRFNGGQAGGWIRTYGNKYNVADGSGVGYQQTQQGLSLGADARVGESQVLVGVLAGTSESDLDLNRGTSGTVKSYYVGPYVTWLDSDTGYYFDGVLKFNRFRNESKVNLSDGSRTKGDYDNWGVGGSAEFGRHIKLANGYFVEPSAQLSAVQIQGKHYTLDNDMDADGDRMRSLLGKAGATFGRNFGFANGAVAQPYVRAAVAHEFASNNEVKVNNNVFNNDLSGSRAEFGAGVAVAMSQRWQMHFDLDYAKGKHIEQPYGVNLGLRYFW
ncbi:autotransporter outer membrane beta-barrel domain-containing protein [Pseudomonas fluorescens]|uniref:Autotransporter outer membrane beta-barrel domain-containing protein n=2 Tax=Pseudomonas TaxID=286 RepID=A0A423P0X9_PSEFL|nr:MULTISPECIES: autotransporter outer membrane beta-barrel domain-containing protein [Pseudomonas fluorescens group]OOH81970.1 autotransporter outer membrane beta-barrel domain-containing protein [Pseudomonas koreensis]ROO04651.1 autotransporter outer membrane beta-barrel domain-containing protein [Pseudomonas fluorescens]